MCRALTKARRRTLALQVCVLIAIAGSAVAASAPENEDLASLWTRTFDFQTGAGYKDNILLGHYQKEASEFWMNGLEVFLLRIPIDGTQVSIFLSAEDKRYFSSVSINHEDLALANAEVKRDLGHGWNLGFAFQYLYQDQLFDTSISETNRQVIPVVGHGLQTAPFLRKELPDSFFVEGRLQMLRQFLEAPLDDYWQPGAKLTVGKQFGYGSEATVSFEYRDLRYDSRPALDSDADAISGVKLREGQAETEIGLNFYWDKGRHWRTWTRLGFQENRDNGGGFFDYRRYAAAQQLNYKRGRWEFQTGIRWRSYDYLVQTVDASDSRHRRLTLVDQSVRVEVNLSSAWKIFSAFEHEWSISRQLLDDFQVNTISAGVAYEF